MRKGEQKMIYNNILETIGNTPLVKLNSLKLKGRADIYAKIESRNPGGSIKDRAALYMIKDAEEKGILKKGGTIIEPTSGNTGIALAMAGATLGYKVILVMPETMSKERRKLMKAYGADFILTPGALGMKGAVDEAARLAKENGYFQPDQFNNPANVKAHVETTAEEIIRDTEGKIDAFVAAVGTSGTLTGIGRVLKAKVPNVRIFGAEPASSPVLNGGNAAGHKIQGIGTNFVPGNYDSEVAEEIIDIKDEDAFEGARYLAVNEGILAGISSGANLTAAINVADRLGEGKMVVTVLPDTGERYLTTALFGEE